MNAVIEQADCLQWLAAQPADSCDLVFGSPPYMDARTYGINATRGCQEWVDWMLDVTTAAVRVSKGLVLWVVAGVQRDLCYWPGCEGLAWEWWLRGNQLWRPCVWWKVDQNEGGTGIPGSGGRQWLRADWEYVLAFKKQGWLPWADPLVMGHEPVYNRVGGEMSNRTVDGQRINADVGNGAKANRDPWDKHGRDQTVPNHNLAGPTRRANGKKKKVLREMDAPAGTNTDGTRKENVGRPMPKICNPGNCIIVKARVGGGHMGSNLCHENEAPFPFALAEFFVRSFCQPGGTVCDPFSGSGTTADAALTWGRNFRGCDLRESQVELTKKRLAQVQPMLFQT